MDPQKTYSNQKPFTHLRPSVLAWMSRDTYSSAQIQRKNMGVSKNRGILPPKWMVNIREDPIRIDALGVPLFLETPICLEDHPS